MFIFQGPNAFFCLHFCIGAMDPFADALAESDDGEFVGTPERQVRLAEDVTPSKQSSPLETTAAFPPHKKRKGSQPQAVPRSRAAQQSRFVVTPLAESDEVPVVLASQKNHPTAPRICVPFWPAYSVRDLFGNAELGSQWIRLGHDQQWARQLAEAFGLCAKQFNRTWVQCAAKEFKESLIRARHDIAEKQKTPLLKKKLFLGPAVYESRLNGFTLHILDVLRPIYLKVTPALRAWVMQSFMPACSRAIDQDTKESGSQPTVGGDFSFSGSKTYSGVRGKISWCVDNSSWNLHVRKPSRQCCGNVDLNGEPLTVDKSLNGPEYIAAKEAVFEKAVLAWNAYDGSKRFRIKTLEISGDLAAWRLKPVSSESLHEDDGSDSS